jgi:hypothetical protein
LSADKERAEAALLAETDAALKDAPYRFDDEGSDEDEDEDEDESASSLSGSSAMSMAPPRQGAGQWR